MTSDLSPEEILSLKAGGRFLAEALALVCKAVRPGVSTAELNQIAEHELALRNCRPSFKNYYVAGAGEYPAALCISINDEIVHGLPDAGRLLQDGDIVSLDLGAEYQGIYSDMAVTVAAGEISKESQRLIEVTKHSLETGIAAITPGAKIGDIGAAIEEYVESEGFAVIKDYVGHGIGRKPHELPQIPNFGRKGTGPLIADNQALAIEPMVSVGDFHTMVANDGWTVKTLDGSLSAHFEHTVIVENGLPVIVTNFM